MHRFVIRFILLLLVSTVVFGQTSSLGAISSDLMGPVAALTKVLFYISIVCGIGFFLGSLIQYKYHRENPQQVRLSTPLVLFLLAIVFIGLPFLLVWAGAVPWLGY